MFVWCAEVHRNDIKCGENKLLEQLFILYRRNIVGLVRDSFTLGIKSFDSPPDRAFNAVKRGVMDDEIINSGAKLEYEDLDHFH